MVELTTKSNHPNAVKEYLVNLQRKVNPNRIRSILERYGVVGCDALTEMTPVDTGETAMSWSFEIIQNGSSFILQFNNAHVEKGVNIAVILQTGHPTRNGGWVEGRDYINPALQPIFDEIAAKAWGEIKEL